jgi:hypothetical protein
MSDQTRPNGQAQPDEDQTRPSVQSGPAGDQVQPDAQSETRLRVTVREAAGILGTTVEGVRSRIKRGSLDSMRVEGTVYVLLTLDQVDRARPDSRESPVEGQAHPGVLARPGDDQALHRLVDEQREMIDWHKREVERKHTILMTLAQRVPELEAAPVPRESPQTPSEQQSSVTDSSGRRRRGEALLVAPLLRAQITLRASRASLTCPTWPP